MEELINLMGFDIHYRTDDGNYEITNFPEFPQETEKSKMFFKIIDKSKFYDRNIQFPNRLNLIQEVYEIDYNLFNKFNLDELFEFIKKHKNRFINTDTFFKVKLDYENNKCVFTINFYTISEDGLIFVENINELIDIISIEHDIEKFSEKFKDISSREDINIPNEIEYIPILPLIWLDFDENNDLIYFEGFKI